jgi:hypothetical protein
LIQLKGQSTDLLFFSACAPPAGADPLDDHRALQFGYGTEVHSAGASVPKRAFEMDLSINGQQSRE